MRIGGAVAAAYTSPEEWLRMVKDLDYSAVQAPVRYGDRPEVKQAYLDCIRENNLVVGEVGVWKNTISPDEVERWEAISIAKEQLALAEELGANCCVNVTGAAGPVWDGYYPANYSTDTYLLIVDSIREIIDAVKPTRTFYTAEPMPWMHPDSPEDYLQLIKDVDRPAFAVHLDYANMINGMERYRDCAGFIRRCFMLLGPHIKSIHAKDVVLGDSKQLPCCIREGAPGTGIVDFALVMRLAHMLGADTTVFVEHMTEYEEYKSAVAHLREIAGKAGIPVKSIR